jgi:non-specific serine/threonine protein kinase
LCSGKIGGEGLNLVVANHAIFFNEWWNPSNNNQARDRIVRIGQEKKSFIHHIYTKHTLETRIKEIIKEKIDINFELVEKTVIKEMRG